MRRLLLAALLLPVFVTVAPQASARTQACDAGKPAVPGAQVVSATGVEQPGGTVQPPFPGSPPITVPAYCEITLVLTHPGANDKVNVTVWLPVTGWNSWLISWVRRGSDRCTMFHTLELSSTPPWPKMPW